MKILYVMRHAQAQPQSQVFDDHGRSLTEQGERDVHFIGESLANLHVFPDQIIASSACRAHITAQLIADKIHYPHEHILLEPQCYNAAATTLVQLLRQVDDAKERVLLVAHNPGITSLVQYLTGAMINTLPAGSVYALNLEIDHWRDLSEQTGDYYLFLAP